MALNTHNINLKQIFERNLYKLMNTCNRHICNLECYKSDKLPLINHNDMDFHVSYSMKHILMKRHNYYISNKLIDGLSMQIQMLWFYITVIMI